MIDAVSAALGVALDPEVVDRRPGDPPLVVASADLARDELGWTATLGLDEMCTERLVGLAGLPARLSRRPRRAVVGRAREAR